MAPQRRAVRFLLVGALFFTSGVALSACGATHRPLAYVHGWKYALRYVASSAHGSLSSGEAGAVCDAGAQAAWPIGGVSTSNATYHNYLEWAQGCDDAMSKLAASGSGGLSVPL